MAEKSDKLRFGFTTGSCAAAAAKAAVYMLLTGKIKTQIKIQTPKGIDFEANIVDIERSEKCVRCGVIKDGGDDPDVTTGSHIIATVSYCLKQGETKQGGTDPYIIIEGGIGVGRITKPGLDQPVGNAAINHVPRQMIEKEALEICYLCDYKGGLKIEISVPGGESLAEKTFNPRLGIMGGISILGTSGIVEPMSSKALLDTIRVELNQHKALGRSVAAVSPGNYGLEFMLTAYNFDLDKSVKCSNFIGDTIDMAVELGFSKLLLTGHIGKLIKLSGGIMNTHSKEADCRMELLAAAAIKSGCEKEALIRILDSVSTEEGCKILLEQGYLEPVMRDIMEKIMFFLNKRSLGKIEIGCIMYSNQFGLLAASNNAETLLELAKAER